MICMLTTEDNPFNPIDDFDEWFRYDVEKGYGTCNYLARYAEILNSSLENEKKKEEIINQIIKNSFAIDKSGKIVNYKKVLA